MYKIKERNLIGLLTMDNVWVYNDGTILKRDCNSAGQEPEWREIGFYDMEDDSVMLWES